MAYSTKKVQAKRRKQQMKSLSFVMASIVLFMGGFFATYFGISLWGYATHDKLAFLIMASGCYSSFMGAVMFWNWME